MKAVLLIFFSLVVSALYGQGIETKKRIDFIQGGVFIHSVSLPFKASNQLVGLNRLPGLRIGAGINIWKQRKRLCTKYLVSFSAYHQKELHYGYELSNSLLAQYRLFSKIYLEGGLGLGYLHTFEDAALYKTENGQYQQHRDWGRAQCTVNVFMGFLVPVSDRLGLFTNYNSVLQQPFARKAGVLFISHTRIALGARVNLHRL
ncbi:hypothetical protein FNH22_14790 [Fulvivirga sp. M361]|uniref:hypothetical protein n=1 Tax=Fulvivirga sp. M361 TaxID=2594266 RepID=UPI00117A4B26|nr:hypothetical protein [Fulvivirga sp. M361]TRX57676.1 hypothetical protein FNH22_14790 [Fulvivirga sp. M361]